MKLLASFKISQNNVINKVYVRTLKTNNSCHPDILKDFDDHVDDIVFCSHRKKIIKKIASIFITIRYHHCKEINHSTVP